MRYITTKAQQPNVLDILSFKQKALSSKKRENNFSLNYIFSYNNKSKLFIFRIKQHRNTTKKILPTLIYKM